MLLSSGVGKRVVAVCHSTVLGFGYNIPPFSGERFMGTLECRRVAWELMLLLAVFEEPE